MKNELVSLAKSASLLLVYACLLFTSSHIIALF